ncbi:MAG: hypothetical protein OEV95_05615 [Gemmatimonadota bacterium]|nr:hypothetical protein [Gemmatimonadota bacterium]
MIENPLTSEDAAERAQFLHFAVRAGPPVFFLLCAAESFLLMKDRIGGGLFLILLLLNVPFTIGMMLAVWRLIEGTARGFTKMVYAGGNLPPTPEHSAHESLVARGFYAEAIAAYRAHVAGNPLDNLARLKLAAVYRDHAGDPLAAEQLFLEVRRTRPTPQEEIFASNMLIELYRTTGRRDRLRVELARFADRYRGTRGGRSAAELLRDIKTEDREASGRDE